MLDIIDLFECIGQNVMLCYVDIVEFVVMLEKENVFVLLLVVVVLGDCFCLVEEFGNKLNEFL